jgi:parvulin-like peptidyl-prolyl isomerase
MRRRVPLTLLGLLLIAAVNRFAWGADAPADPSGPVAATVNGEPIFAAEVRTAVEQALHGQQLSPEELTKARAEALAQLIDKCLVKAVVTKAGLWASDAQVDAALKQIRLQREQQKISWPEYLQERGLSEAAFRRQLAWQLSWEKFLQGRLTDAMLEDYFKAHQQEFDGTLVRVSHLLLGPLPSDREATAELVDTASGLREQITSGKVAFEAAVKKYSTGPSREQGGDLGFLPRHGVMVEAFSRAAFQLKPGEISPPIVTPFGVHLIKAVEVKPGGKKWTDIRDEIKPPAAQALFHDVAKRERASAKIAFSGAIGGRNAVW